MPDEVTFHTKPEIALDQIRATLEAGVPSSVVLMGIGDGADTNLREAIAALGLPFVAGIQPHTSVWTRANPPPPVRPWSGRARPTSRMVRDTDHQPQSAEGLALSLPAEAWEMITWLEGGNGALTSRFACVQVRAAHRDVDRSVPRHVEWLLFEWPPQEVGGRLSFRMTGPEGTAAVEGTFRVVDPPHRVVLAWTWSQRPAGEAPLEAPSLVTFAIAPDGTGSRLTLTHEQLPDADKARSHAQGGSVANSDRGQAGASGRALAGQTRPRARCTKLTSPATPATPGR